MAEDDSAVAEGSASWRLQGGMGLHLRGRGLQLSPYEESGGSSDVTRGRRVFAGPRMNPQDTSGCSLNPSPSHKITETGKNLSHRVHFSAACYTTSTLTAGAHGITAVYGGDSNFAGSR